MPPNEDHTLSKALMPGLAEQGVRNALYGSFCAHAAYRPSAESGEYQYRGQFHKPALFNDTDVRALGFVASIMRTYFITERR